MQNRWDQQSGREGRENGGRSSSRGRSGGRDYYEDDDMQRRAMGQSNDRYGRGESQDSYPHERVGDDWRRQSDRPSRWRAEEADQWGSGSDERWSAQGGQGGQRGEEYRRQGGGMGYGRSGRDAYASSEYGASDFNRMQNRQTYGGGFGQGSGGQGHGGQDFGGEGYGAQDFGYGRGGHQAGGDQFSGQHGGGFGGGQHSQVGQSSGRYSASEQSRYSGGESGGGRGGDPAAFNDPDYLEWRSAQMRNWDEDYRSFRSERQKKFADEFDSWRKNRDQSASGDDKSSSGKASTMSSTGSLSKSGNQ